MIQVAKESGKNKWRHKITKSLSIKTYFFFKHLKTSISHSRKQIIRESLSLFLDDSFWMIRGYAVLPDYPKSIYTLGFPRYVKKIDAAFCDHRTRKTYFFVGIWCWR